ncbi:MAG TPA: DUF4097 family beta strand repeat-containing protein [Gaiellaceae bacterium]|jgi:hypothetical protein
MSRIRKIAVGAAVVVAAAGVAAAVALGKGAFDTTQSGHSRVAGPVHTVVVDGDAGSVHFTAAGRAPVEVTHTSSWLFSKPTVRQSLDDGILYLRSRCSGGLSCDTDFEVRAAAGTSVEVNEDASDVTVQGAPGDVTVKTDAGRIHVDLTRAPNRIHAETDAGTVHVVVPRGVYAVDTRTDAGSETVRGLVRSDGAARTIEARSDAGDVTVEAR